MNSNFQKEFDSELDDMKKIISGFMWRAVLGALILFLGLLAGTLGLLKLFGVI